MSTFATDLRTWLLANQPLASHLGGRITWGNAVQSTPSPYLVLQMTGEDAGYTMDGNDGLRAITVQMDCYSEFFLHNETTKAMLLVLLDGFRGSIENTVTQGVFFRNASSEYDDKDKIFRTSIDFEFMVQQPNLQLTH